MILNPRKISKDVENDRGHSTPKTGELVRSCSSPNFLHEHPVQTHSPGTAEFVSLLREAVDSLHSRFDKLECRLMKELDKRFERFETRLYDAERRADRLESALVRLEATGKERDNRITTLTKELDEVREQLNQREQYQRLDNLRIHGLPDEDKETIQDCQKKVEKFFVKDLGITEKIDISVAHRLGRPSEHYNRPVVVKLVKRRDKNTIFKARAKLRDAKSSIYISEDMTQANMRLIRDLKKNERIKSVWTFNGKINVEGTNGKKLFDITRSTDVNGLLSRYNRQ